MRTVLLVVAFALLLPASASAGGWATAGILNPPGEVKPGDTWTARIEILQHGRRPLEGVEPAVVLKAPDGTAEEFRAVATGEPGIYTAEVTFGAAGRYEYLVDDGFGNAGRPGHAFPPVDVRATAATPVAPPPSDDFPYLPVIGAVLAALAVAAGSMTLIRRRRGTVPA